MSEVRNCSICGAIYKFEGGAPICRKCLISKEKDFTKIRDYILNNPGSSAAVISSELGIRIEVINWCLKEGRIEKLC